MGTFLASIVALSLPCAPNVAQPGPGGNDQGRTEGTWEVVACKRWGKDVPRADWPFVLAVLAADDVTLIDRRAAWWPVRRASYGACSFGPNEQPPSIEFWLQKVESYEWPFVWRPSVVHGPRLCWRGVYRLQGGTLALCLGGPVLGCPRPDKLSTSPGDPGHVLLLLKRVGP